MLADTRRLHPSRTPRTRDVSSWRAPGVENVTQPRHFGGLHRLPRACHSFREVWSVRVWDGWICLGNLRARSLGVGVRWVRDVHRRQEAGDAQGDQSVHQGADGGQSEARAEVVRARLVKAMKDAFA